MDSNDQEQLFDSCLNTYRPTWAQLGKISREGQTGQMAEKLIAESIVNITYDLIGLPDKNIINLIKK